MVCSGRWWLSMPFAALELIDTALQRIESPHQLFN
jgi:hypothetical protein